MLIESKFFSVDQLKEQMDKIKVKRSKLESEQFSLQYNKENVISKNSIEKSIRDYCKQVDRKLESIEGNFESKRHLLTLALNRITIDGKEVRIRGIIPTHPLEESSLAGSIASTASDNCVRRQQQFPDPFSHGFDL